ncbi:(R,R)-butanediol dehydrogenase/meso-butanediol dehydrogenase/diacetyl reductase/L-iditol 2-dehydrogenase [Hydrogenispora ethanolica]|uniref:(R,R)-butanediol dehydrogenase/meso-butanediol dehydrogenase/diacetyl reductase/L-iditol 2-dehydrogenase n=1 Tax=Hydrogenispora ethanolica TaxID=1082276 RepID=A0A4R1S529_HYDET|nr:alcohol dehydrogenase catalytic domain-containing protein [Hydrogenispora ethanolica]TCL74114.1 (R,R)-butanediol dehydrogenase/meso-butanediol dehydrogenase/diacetyl reductase/L-iditol 2-dehydrogenase [Hydrogenispora ethanolica]
MKAAVLKKPQTLVVEEIPKRSYDQSQVLVEVKACGICGSDLRYYKGENPWALHTLGENRPNPANIIFGHEFAGDVVEVGNPDFKEMIGKRVGILAFNTCGVCEFCRTGRYNLCKNTKHIGHGAGWGEMSYYPGGMAEYCEVWRTHVCEIPDSISYEEATLLDPISVAIHAITQTAIQPADQVLVLGSGPVGLCISQAVRAYGASRVYCTDVFDKALEIAGSIGVDEALDSRKTDIVGFIAKKTHNRGVNIVFDTVGTAQSQSDALKCLAVSGTLVNLVANETKASYRLMDLSGERRIVSSANNKYEDYLLGIELLESGVIQAKPLITHTLPLEQVNEGFNILFHKEQYQAMKVIILP